MKGYIFKVLTADNKIKYCAGTADNIKSARKKFAKRSSKWPKGWCLLAVYREV